MDGSSDGTVNLERCNDLTGVTVVHLASESGDTATIKHQATLGADINCRDQQGCTPLHYAVWAGQQDAVECLAGLGANVNCFDEHGSTPLHYASHAGNEPLARCILELGPSINFQNLCRETPLHNGCKEGNAVTLTETLISHGADIRCEDELGRTPIHFASLAGKASVVECLHFFGANVNCCDKRQQTPLHYACISGHVNTMRSLLKLNGDINYRDNDFRIPLHYASKAGATKAVITLLRHSGRSCPHKDVCDVNGQTPLHIASMEGHLSTITALLKLDADVDCRDRRQRTPLHYASKAGMDSLVCQLIFYDATVDCCDRKARTPLHYASKFGKTSAVILLTYFGANVWSVDTLNETALSLSARHKHRDTTGVLLHKASSQLQSPADALSALLSCNSAEVCAAAERLSNTYLERAVKTARKRSLKFAWSSVVIPGDGSLDNVPSGGDLFDVSHLHQLLSLATEKGKMEVAMMACSLGALQVANARTFASVLQLAVREKSLDLALMVCRAKGLCLDDQPEITAGLLEMAVYRRSVELSLLVLDARTDSHLQPVPQILSGVLVLGILTNTRQLVMSSCKAGVLELTHAEDIWEEILRIGMEEESAQLLILACKAGTLQTTFIQQVEGDLLRVAMKIFSTELIAIVCKAGKLKTRKGQEAIEDLLRMAVERSSVELMLIASKAGALETEFGRTSTTMIRRLAIEESSHDLLMELCTAGRLLSSRQIDHDLMTSFIEAVLKNGWVDLALLLINAGHIVTDDKLYHAALLMGIQEISVELVTRLSSAGGLNSANKEIKDGILHLALRQQGGKQLLIVLAKQGNITHKEAVLHHAASTGDLALADVCISNGALHREHEWVRPTPIDIAIQNGYSRLAQRLKRAVDSEKLLKFGERRADTVLLRIGGPPGAGKSTMVESLKTSRLYGAFRRESQTDEGDKNYLTRTKGIRVHTYKNNRIRYQVLDLAGHDDFAAANQLFIGQGHVPIINILVLSSLMDSVVLEDEVMKWCAFYASSYQDSSQPEHTMSGAAHSARQHNQPMLFVLTRSFEASEKDNTSVYDVFAEAKRRFSKFLLFHDIPLFVDARKSWTMEMKKLRQVLNHLKEIVLESTPNQPALCDDIKRALPWICKKTKTPTILRKDLLDKVAQGLKSSTKRKFDKNVVLSHAGCYIRVTLGAN